MPLALCFALGCHKGKGETGTENAQQNLTLEQAQAIVDEERARAGMHGSADPAPQSIAEVLQILRRDDSARFAQARDYLTPLEGVDALIVRASLEALWADGLLTVAAVASERGERKKAQADTIKEEQRGTPNDPALAERLKQTEAEQQREERLSRALKVLAKSHHYTGTSLAREVERRNPERPEGYAILANLFRLHRDWIEFEANMQKAQARSEERVGMLYARAMERAARLGDRAGARQELETLLAEHPDFARARAQLVLLQDDIEQRYAQLQQLKTLNPRHALIQLEGPAIEREYETASALRAAQTEAQPLPAPGPSAP